MNLLQSVAAGMIAQRVRVEVAASNITNAQTARIRECGYHRRLICTSVDNGNFISTNVVADDAFA